MKSQISDKSSKELVINKTRFNDFQSILFTGDKLNKSTRTISFRFMLKFYRANLIPILLIKAFFIKHDTVPYLTKISRFSNVN
jgi:hypothetical protein